MGTTGAMLSFEPELLHWMNPDVMRVVPQDQPLPLSELLGKVRAAYPGREIMSMTVNAEADHSVPVTLVAVANKSAMIETTRPVKGPQRRRGEVRYFNPYNGTLLSRNDLNGQGAFQTIERIHRGMIAGPIGRTMVGISALLLFVMALAGLYLRWPRQGKLQWRTWFNINSKLKGRAYLWNWHTVIATGVLPLVLLSSFTGSYQAFDWYRQAVMMVAGATPPVREAIKLDQATASPDADTNVDAVWTAFQTQHEFTSATIVFPQSSASAVEIRYLTVASPHERAFNFVAMHPVTGDLIKQQDYAEKNTGNRFISGILPLHTGTYFGVTGRMLMLLSALSMPFFATTGWMMYLQRRRSQAAKASAAIAKVRPVS